MAMSCFNLCNSAHVDAEIVRAQSMLTTGKNQQSMVSGSHRSSDVGRKFDPPKYAKRSERVFFPNIFHPKEFSWKHQLRTSFDRISCVYTYEFYSSLNKVRTKCSKCCYSTWEILDHRRYSNSDFSLFLSKMSSKKNIYWKTTEIYLKKTYESHTHTQILKHNANNKQEKLFCVMPNVNKIDTVETTEKPKLKAVDCELNGEEKWEIWKWGMQKMRKKISEKRKNNNKNVYRIKM